MLKFECKKGHVSISGSGTTQELISDVLTCVHTVWDNIGEPDLFKQVVKAAINDDVTFCKDLKDLESKRKEKHHEVMSEIKGMLKSAGFDVGDDLQ